MNRLCNDIFSGSSLTLNQYGAFQGSYHVDFFEYVLECLA